jgi:hypothetical protein
LRSVLLDAAKVNESTDISDMTALRRSSKSRTPATTPCSTSHFALIATIIAAGVLVDHLILRPQWYKSFS